MGHAGQRPGQSASQQESNYSKTCLFLRTHKKFINHFAIYKIDSGLPLSPDHKMAFSLGISYPSSKNMSCALQLGSVQIHPCHPLVTRLGLI